MPHLILVPAGPGAPPDPGRHEIGPDLALVIGRDATCDIRIDESQDVVSRRHLSVRWDGQALVAHDSSSNGLFVNGQRVVKSQTIHDEDVIQLGANGPVFTVALDPKPVKAPPPAKETRMLAPTRPPQPVIEVAAAASPEPASATPAPSETTSAQDALQDIARGGKKLISSAAASIKQSMEEQSTKGAPFSSPSVPSRSSHQGGFMLTRIVVQLYAGILEFALWIVLLVGLVSGWYAKGLIGAFVGMLLAAVFSAVLFGAFLVLEDIRRSVRVIEDRINAKE